MLVQYDQAMKVLSTALASKEVAVVLQSRADLDLIRLRARQVRDRTLLADATEFQMKVERWLGKLLIEIKRSGFVSQGRKRKDNSKPNRVTLGEIGVDRKLSSKAQRAAAMNEEAFGAAILEMRSAISGGGAKVVTAAPRYTPPSSKSASLYDLHLSDGTRLGSVRLGKLRARIEVLVSEANMLQAICNHVGGGSADGLATIASTVNEHALQEIIRGLEQLKH